MNVATPSHFAAIRRERPAAAHTALTLLTLVLAATTLPACAPLVVGGAVAAGTMVAIDRRTSGAQIEDQAIELKAVGRLRELGVGGHVNVTSYNRTVLVTGEVAKEADRQTVEQAVTRIENVRAVVNELAVMEQSSLGSRSNDSILSAKVKAAFVDAQDLQATAAKVVSERGNVYLLGRVTEREAARFADVARGVKGVAKVIRVFEVISEAELAGIAPRK